MTGGLLLQTSTAIGKLLVQIIIPQKREDFDMKVQGVNSEMGLKGSGFRRFLKVRAASVKNPPYPQP